MAAVKKTGLPKGISWREDRKQYLGRVTYKRQKYLFYDKDWRRLERRLNELRVELDKGQYVKESTLTLDACLKNGWSCIRRIQLRLVHMRIIRIIISIMSRRKLVRRKCVMLQ